MKGKLGAPKFLAFGGDKINHVTFIKSPIASASGADIRRCGKQTYSSGCSGNISSSGCSGRSSGGMHMAHSIIPLRVITNAVVITLIVVFFQSSHGNRARSVAIVGSSCCRHWWQLLLVVVFFG